MNDKVFYLDTETTGLDERKNDIIQLSYLVEINKEIKEEGQFFIQPFDYGAIQPRALEVSKTTIEQLKGYEQPNIVYKKVVNILDKYVDKYNRQDKFSPAGYNVGFDVGFMKNFFFKNNDKYWGSYFTYHFLDVFNFVYILEYKGLLKLDNYKLITVAKFFGIDFDAHDSLSDIKTTREVFLKLLEYIK